MIAIGNNTSSRNFLQNPLDSLRVRYKVNVVISDHFIQYYTVKITILLKRTFNNITQTNIISPFLKQLNQSINSKKKCPIFILENFK